MFFELFSVICAYVREVKLMVEPHSIRLIDGIAVHRQAILLLAVESGTRKFSCLSVECLSVESGTYDVICQFCTVKGMVVESEVLKAQNCALSKFSLPMHSNGVETSAPDSPLSHFSYRARSRMKFGGKVEQVLTLPTIQTVSL